MAVIFVDSYPLWIFLGVAISRKYYKQALYDKAIKWAMFPLLHPLIMVVMIFIGLNLR